MCTSSNHQEFVDNNNMDFLPVNQSDPTTSTSSRGNWQTYAPNLSSDLIHRRTGITDQSLENNFDDLSLDDDVNANEHMMIMQEIDNTSFLQYGR